MSGVAQNDPAMELPRKITPDNQPVFPCWIHHKETGWYRYVIGTLIGFGSDDYQKMGYTHWLPDQPTAPTCAPGEPVKVENTRDCLRCEGTGDSPSNKGICGACGGRGYIPCAAPQPPQPMSEGETPRVDAASSLEDGVTECSWHRYHKLRDEAVKLERELNAAREEVERLAKKQPINTHVRLFDLVRQQRSELHQADLITDEEYVWLSGGAKLANDPRGGSPSPRRLEDYDALMAEVKQLRAQLATQPAPRDVIAQAKDALVDCSLHLQDMKAFGSTVNDGIVNRANAACDSLRALLAAEPKDAEPGDKEMLDWLEKHSVAFPTDRRQTIKFETPAQCTDDYEKPTVRGAIDLAMRDEKGGQS